ncbi:MAG: hypothetical protein Kow0092_34640 [Deferrisomatales bacterium]
MIDATLIGRALQHATFPIRSFEELHDALHRHLGGVEHEDRCEIRQMESLFSPRDFLFTNASQIQQVVAARQGSLELEGDDLH